MVPHSWGRASQRCQSDLAPAVEQAQVPELGVLLGRARTRREYSILKIKRGKKYCYLPCTVQTQKMLFYHGSKLMKTSSKDLLWVKQNASFYSQVFSSIDIVLWFQIKPLWNETPDFENVKTILHHHFFSSCFISQIQHEAVNDK